MPKPPSATFDVERVDDVVVQQFEVLVPKPVLNVTLTAREEVVGDRDLVTFEHELVNQVRADESSATCHLQTCHRRCARDG